MKKTYQQPLLSVVTIKMQGMLAASVEIGEAWDDSQGGVGARDFDFEEEEEY